MKEIQKNTVGIHNSNYDDISVEYFDKSFKNNNNYKPQNLKWKSISDFVENYFPKINGVEKYSQDYLNNLRIKKIKIDSELLRLKQERIEIQNKLKKLMMSDKIHIDNNNNNEIKLEPNIPSTTTKLFTQQHTDDDKCNLIQVQPLDYNNTTIQNFDSEIIIHHDEL